MSPAPHASVSFPTQAFLESVPFLLELIVCSYQESARPPEWLSPVPLRAVCSGPESPSTHGWGLVGCRVRFCILLFP